MTAPRPRVLIAGGGAAALESALALRDLAGDAFELTLAAAQDSFRFRPRAPADVLAVASLTLASFAADLEARHEPVAVTRVDAGARRAEFSTGERREYDALLLAVGARPVPSVPGATTWWDEMEQGVPAEIAREIRTARVRRVVFLVTPGCGWAVPLYELALTTARALTPDEAGRVEITIATHEAAPLSLLGPRASTAVGGQLEAAGIRVLTGVRPDAKRTTDDRLVLLPGSVAVEADELIALPRLEGPRIAGVPANRLGFVPVDPHGQVVGAERIWAAGDATAFPIKQEDLTARQAAAAAVSIAAAFGIAVVPAPFDPTLRGTLLTEPSSADGDGDMAAQRPLWWSATGAGRHLEPYLAGLAVEPAGLAVEIPLGGTSPGRAGTPGTPELPEPAWLRPRSRAAAPRG